MTRELKVAIAACDFARSAAVTPRSENVKQAQSRLIMNIGVRCRKEGSNAYPMMNIRLVLRRPRQTPSSFPDVLRCTGAVPGSSAL